MNPGAPASRQTAGAKPELAGETPAFPGIAMVIDRRYNFLKTSRIESKTARTILPTCLGVVQ
jgi:hypothetical protein